MAATERTLHGPPEQVAAVLRERIYGGIACLSTLLVLARPEAEANAWRVFGDVAVATGGLWAASVLADFVAHLAAHGRGLRGREAASTLRASGQILEAAYVPLLLLALAGHRRDAVGAGVVGGDLGLDRLARAVRSARRAPYRPPLVAASPGRGGTGRTRGTRRAAQDGHALTREKLRGASGSRTRVAGRYGRPDLLTGSSARRRATSASRSTPSTSSRRNREPGSSGGGRTTR